MPSNENTPGKRVPPKPKADLKTLKRLFSYITKDYKLPFAMVLIGILLSSAANVAGSLFLEILIDDYILPLLAVENPVFDGLLKAILIMSGIYLLGVISTLVYSQLMVVIAQGVLKKIRDEMFDHMQELPIEYFDTHSHGDLMSHFTNDTDTLRQMLAQTIPQLFSSVTTITAVFCAMVATSLHLTFVVILTLVFMYFVTGKIARKSKNYFIRQQKSLGKINGFIEEMITGQKVIKVFNHEEEAKKQFDLLNDELCHNATEANRFANILMPVMANIGNIQYVLIAIAGGALAVGGIDGITLGAIASFLQLSRTLSMPVSHVSQQLNAIVMALAGAKRIFDLMDEKKETDHGYVTLVNAKYEDNWLVETSEPTGIWAWKIPNEDKTFTYIRLRGDVRFYNVNFSYNKEKTVLHDITLYAEPGQKVAFVGETGAGKTTITNLINRFYEIDSGKILYDGIDIQKIRKSDLRRSLGIVLQDTNLFTGTVMENIRYGKLDASDEEVYAAAKLAKADEFISILPQGYDTVIQGDGSGLSQGQRQLLNIARAAVANPPVMILDEATSSIDTRTEFIVQKGMDALMRGRTVFVIAHRLSTIQNSEAIMVLDQGRIIERGDHDQLISEKGKYYQLYTGAFE
ncbi:ABC transporter ATP-binding protein [Thermoactinomyces mirandus]|uniref:ABC transporter ATP-binding protein n=1 Tax=Thermoactinomyces mirandus TaxID=2756294 RepID=A0A7W1XU91_9BACL|nr:ABC transporter ATP-binding protein [Thermoactinomyces mirandus]MBA4603371.1 ABC transporter ATP-binding protein [Thermoactinomyces mirandus]